MAVRPISGEELIELLANATEPSLLGDALLVDGVPDHADDERWRRALERLATTPCLVIGCEGWQDADAAVRALVDVVADDATTRAAIVETVEQAPVASTALALLLRGSERRTVAEGLLAESAVYSSLQAGPEFAAWRRATPVRHRPEPGGPAVLVARVDDDLHIELCRPEVRNALGVDMRDGLLDALAIADADPTLLVTITGRGPAFCAGGDLDEFGTAPDPATAHLIRLDRSIGAVLTRLANRVTVHLHGACYGSGIELPAFAGRVVAHPDTSIALPELRMGLVPGAGGTVSVSARAGRHVTALLALTARPVDARTALGWGLVDEVTA